MCEYTYEDVVLSRLSFDVLCADVWLDVYDAEAVAATDDVDNDGDDDD